MQFAWEVGGSTLSSRKFVEREVGEIPIGVIDATRGQCRSNHPRRRIRVVMILQRRLRFQEKGSAFCRE